MCLTVNMKEEKIDERTSLVIRLSMNVKFATKAQYLRHRPAKTERTVESMEALSHQDSGVKW